MCAFSVFKVVQIFQSSSKRTLDLSKYSDYLSWFLRDKLLHLVILTVRDNSVMNYFRFVYAILIKYIIWSRTNSNVLFCKCRQRFNPPDFIFFWQCTIINGICQKSVKKSLYDRVGYVMSALIPPLENFTLCTENEHSSTLAKLRIYPLTQSIWKRS